MRRNELIPISSLATLHLTLMTNNLGIQSRHPHGGRDTEGGGGKAQHSSVIAAITGRNASDQTQIYEFLTALTHFPPCINEQDLSALPPGEDKQIRGGWQQKGEQMGSEHCAPCFQRQVLNCRIESFLAAERTGD